MTLFRAFFASGEQVKMYSDKGAAIVLADLQMQAKSKGTHLKHVDCPEENATLLTDGVWTPPADPIPEPGLGGHDGPDEPEPDMVDEPEGAEPEE